MFEKTNNTMRMLEKINSSKKKLEIVMRPGCHQYHCSLVAWPNMKSYDVIIIYIYIVAAVDYIMCI